MKKEINKIILFIGFLTTLVGLWLGVFTAEEAYEFEMLLSGVLTIVLAFAFVNAANKVLNIIGYSFSAILGAVGLSNILLAPIEIEDGYEVVVLGTGTLVMSIGMIIMAFAAIIYLFVVLLNFFGFVKKTEKETKNTCLLGELARYKEMQDDGILTVEEFSDLKQKAFEGADTDAPSMDDLKKWKKLLDQKVISEEEFANIKKNLFAK